MKYFVTAVVIFLLLLATSCSTQRAISHYSGDGEIVGMPDGGFWQGGGGYRVRFESVRLDHPAHLTYHFGGLPKIAWRVEVYFAIEGPKQWTRDGTHRRPPFNEDQSGTLALTLKDADGQVILNYKHKLSEFRWAGGSGAWGLYDEKNVGFTANPQKKYVLELSIEPDEALKDYDGYILFKSGGHEGTSIGF